MASPHTQRPTRRGLTYLLPDEITLVQDAMMCMYFTGWFDHTFPSSVCTVPGDRACSARVLTFLYVRYSLWMVTDHECNTSDRPVVPAHWTTRPDTHRSDRQNHSTTLYDHGTVRFSTCCEQLPSAAAPGAVREARGGLLQPRSRPPASCRRGRPAARRGRSPRRCW